MALSSSESLSNMRAGSVTSSSEYMAASSTSAALWAAAACASAILSFTSLSSTSCSRTRTSCSSSEVLEKSCSCCSSVSRHSATILSESVWVATSLSYLPLRPLVTLFTNFLCCSSDLMFSPRAKTRAGIPVPSFSAAVIVACRI